MALVAVLVVLLVVVAGSSSSQTLLATISADISEQSSHLDWELSLTPSHPEPPVISEGKM